MKTQLTACLLLLASYSLHADPTEQTLPTREIHADASVAAANTDASTAPSAILLNQDFSSSSWFDSVDLTLRRDRDGDRFYTQIYIRFDAHTQYTEQPVYAVYSLIGPGLNRIFHTSSIFTLYGSSRTDWFAIEVDMRDLPRDYYKLKIELRDARSGAKLAEISGYEAAALNNLALEDGPADTPVSVIVHESSGGSLGFFWPVALSWLYLKRRKLMS
jgi:hypothetical protein